MEKMRKSGAKRPIFAKIVIFYFFFNANFESPILSFFLTLEQILKKNTDRDADWN